jgi:hypothetical protein
VSDRKRRIGAGLLLAAGSGVAAAAARRLVIQGEDLSRRPSSAPALLAFGACLLLAFAAGRLAGRAPRPAPPVAPREEDPAPSSLLRLVAAVVAGLVAALLFARVSALQGRARVPLGALAIWGAAVLTGFTAIALAARPWRGGSRAVIRFPRGIAAALLAVLVLGGWCRLAVLDAVPAAFGGDEANQVSDALGLMRGGSETDPFGIGWGGTVHLGMLPAGIGALLSSDSISGPRRPYAVVGTLSLGVSAVAGGLVAGPWGALATGALLAFAPHHVHFSRLASVMVLDALLAMVFLLLALWVFETGSPPLGFLAASAAGLSLYGYVGGRVVPIAFLLAAPLLIFSPAARRRRGLLALALLAGFALAAGPNLRFAARHPNDWNSRFNQTVIFRSDWWGPKVQELGSSSRILKEQFLAGTVDLLSGQSHWAWFTGYPIVAPSFLPALATAGLGWLVGRGRFFPAFLLGLLVAGNLAAVMLTDSAPAPQRLSSLFPALAVLGGAAVSGFLSLLSGPGQPGGFRQLVAGTVLVGGILVGSFRGFPPWWDPSPGYGQATAAFLRSAARVLRAPRYRGERIYLEGLPYIDSTFPLCEYLLPGTRWSNRDPGKEEGRPEPGLHLFSPEWAPFSRLSRARWGIAHAVALPDPWDPRRDLGCLVRVR